MRARDALTRWLKSLPHDGLRQLRRRTGLVQYRTEHLPQLAFLLLQDHVVADSLSHCNLPEIQLLGTVAWLAGQRHGPYRANHWAPLEPTERAVPAGDVLELVAGDGARWRREAESVLEGLVAAALVMPGDPAQIAVPGYVHRYLGNAGRAGPEIAAAIKRARLKGLDVHPPIAESHVVPADERQAEAAATLVAGQIDRLLAACADEPLALRQAGGVAVRETKRVAKRIGIDVDLARFLIDLCYAADLLGTEPRTYMPGRPGRRAAEPSLVMPTTAYDQWLAGPPAERLTPILTAWSAVNAVFTLEAGDGETPVALAGRHMAAAKATRYALLEALSAGPTESLDENLAAVSWHRPLWMSTQPELVDATLREAELLGVVAGGRLTRVGLAVLGSQRGVSTTEIAQALTQLLPPPQERALFQADMTAVVAGAPTAGLAELLGSVADRESEGHAVVWRFGAASVRRALDAGRDAASLLADLSEVAQGPLPQPLEYLIKDVARAHGRMRVVRAGCCIRSDDEALVSEMAKARGLAKLKPRRIAPTVLVSVLSPKETLKALRAAGYTPVLEAATGDTVVEKASRRRAPSRT